MPTPTKSAPKSAPGAPPQSNPPGQEVAPFQFPQEAADTVRNSQESLIGLPFPTLVWYIKNGQPAAKTIGGVGYTGGLACGDLPQSGLTLIDVWGVEKDVIELFKDRIIENVNQDGNPYETVEMQVLEIVPIVSRKRFVEGRSHTQVLAFLKLPGDIVSFALISARGYQSSILIDELGKVASGTAGARKAIGNPPTSFFWHKIGMPSKPEFRPVGKAATSLITPVHAVISNEDLRACYIGNELAVLMGETTARDEVKIWKDAWNKPDQNQPTQENNQRPSGPRPYQPADDIPF